MLNKNVMDWNNDDLLQPVRWCEREDPCLGTGTQDLPFLSWKISVYARLPQAQSFFKICWKKRFVNSTNHRFLESKSHLWRWLRKKALCCGTSDTMRCRNCNERVGSVTQVVGEVQKVNNTWPWKAKSQPDVWSPRRRFCRTNRPNNHLAGMRSESVRLQFWAWVHFSLRICMWMI